MLIFLFFFFFFFISRLVSFISRSGLWHPPPFFFKFFCRRLRLNECETTCGITTPEYSYMHGDLCIHFVLLPASRRVCHLNEIKNLFHISFCEPRKRRWNPVRLSPESRQKSFDRIIIRCRRRGQIRTSFHAVPRNLKQWMQAAACMFFFNVCLCLFFCFVLFCFNFFLSFKRRWWWTSGLDFPASYK